MSNFERINTGKALVWSTVIIAIFGILALSTSEVIADKKKQDVIHEDADNLVDDNNKRLLWKLSPCPGPNCTADLSPSPQAKGNRVVFLEFNGARLQKSMTDDSALPQNGYDGVSAIVNSTTEVIPAFDHEDIPGGWNYTRQQIINAIKGQLDVMFQPYDITVVTSRPASGSYHMVVFGGTCQSVVGQDCAGIALRDCGDWMPNNIVFAFPGGLSYKQVAATAAQELAHAFGLGHTDDRFDVMYPTILSSVDPTGFGEGNIMGADGQNDMSGCPSSAVYQDSNAMLMTNIGPRGQDLKGPMVSITSPANGAVVQAGSPITANVTDENGITEARLEVDGQIVQTRTSAPYNFTLPVDTTSGERLVAVRAYDPIGNMGFKRIALYVSSGNETACTNSSECPAEHECRNNICIPLGNNGNLGDLCGGDQDCVSGLCGTVGNDSRCTEPCAQNSDCPDGFECLSGSACWPTSGGGNNNEGGVTSTGCGLSISGKVTGRGVGGALIIFAFAAFLLLLRRKKTE